MGNSLRSTIERVRLRYQESGVGGIFLKVIAVPARGLRDFFLNTFFRLSSPKKFSFQGKPYSYTRHTYNHSWKNERTVEVSIIGALVRDSHAERILEIGNVLLNYSNAYRHTVLDKYEPGFGIIHEDIATFHPEKPYDLVVSISTLEHVGWDETPRDPEKILRTLVTIRERCLAPNGTAIITMPWGFNPHVDRWFREGRKLFDRVYFLKRMTADNQWKEVPFSEVENCIYGHPFPSANAVIIGVIGKLLQGL